MEGRELLDMPLLGSLVGEQLEQYFGLQPQLVILALFLQTGFSMCTLNLANVLFVFC